MTSKAATPDQYIKELPADRKELVTQLRNTISKNIPKGFKEVMSYGMIGWVVPHELYPPGYHCDHLLPLPFVNIASQKNFIALYHMGIYSNPELLKWFTAEYAKQGLSKLDMGKSCIRFKKPGDIPYKLIGELMKKVTVKDWVSVYEKALKQRKA
jgi:uncharacterized protein YdhG (YjbR/CyaY superfamily)